MRSPLLASSLALVAAAGCSQPVVTDRYVAFDQATVTAAQAKVMVLEDLRGALEAKDFATIKTSYEKNFQTDLKALAASHPYVSEGAGLGVALDKQATDGIALGTNTMDPAIKEAGEEIVQMIVFRYAFETIHAELKKNTKEGWDRAFTYYGRSADGTMSILISEKTVSRDTEFAVKNNDKVFQAFIDGRNKLAAGDTAGATEKSALIDQTITEIFGLQARHEFGEGADAVTANMPADAIEPFAVGRGVVNILRDWIKTRPNGTAAASTIDAELAKGDPTMPQTMSLVDFAKIVTTVDTVFGFKL